MPKPQFLMYKLEKKEVPTSENYCGNLGRRRTKYSEHGS